jgi:hypothetical protein
MCRVLTMTSCTCHAVFSNTAAIIVVEWYCGMMSSNHQSTLANRRIKKGKGEREEVSESWMR